jgi:prevent-host-death family protein
MNKKNQWQLQDAKKRFSELVDRAISSGPQIVTRWGKEVVVILSKDEYRGLTARQSSLVDFFRESPLVGLELELERDKSLPRETQL